MKNKGKLGSRLSLHRETLRSLAREALAVPVGGVAGGTGATCYANDTGTPGGEKCCLKDPFKY